MKTLKLALTSAAAVLALVSSAQADEGTDLDGTWKIHPEITKLLGSSAETGLQFPGEESPTRWLRIRKGKFSPDKDFANPRPFTITDDKIGYSIKGKKYSLEWKLIAGKKMESDLLFLTTGKENFALVRSLKSLRTELELTLPKLAPAEAPANGSLIIDIAADGSLAADGKSISEAKLESLLEELAGNDKDAGVILRGDRKTKFEGITNALEICQEAKIWNVSFATKRPAASATIRIDKKGALSLDGSAVTSKELKEKLRAIRKEHGEKLTVVIAAHDDGKTENFVDVINLLAELEIKNLTMTGFSNKDEAKGK